MTFHPVLPADTTQPTQITPSGDATGATDLAHIKTALTNTGVANLAKGAFTINGAIPLTNGQSIYGAGAALTTITQTSTSANGISVVDTNLADNTIQGLTITGPGQGTGTGIGIFASANSGANAVFRISLNGIKVNLWGSDGVQIANSLISSMTRVRSELNGRRGFYLNVGTTMSAESCAAVSNTERGWFLQNMIAGSLVCCGGDTNGLGYELNACNGCVLSACDGVSNAAGGGVDGSTVKLNAGSNNSVRNFYCSGNGAVAFNVVGGEFDSTFDCCIETSPVGGATASLSSASNLTVINPNFTTATSVSGLLTQVTSTASTFNVANYFLLKCGNTGGGNFSSGSGAPSKPFGVNPVAGDIYTRTDTPSTANQRIYICTTGGASPVWSGIV